jgi:hypothetical protein
MEKYNQYNEIVKSKSPCQSQWKKLLAAKSDAEYFDILKHNIPWLRRNGIVSHLIKVFTADELAAQNIFFNGNYTINEGIAVACDNSTVKAWGNSTVEAWGNSTVEAFDNSTIIFRHYGSPKFLYDKEKSKFVILKDELNGKTHIIVNGVEKIIINQ